MMRAPALAAQPADRLARLALGLGGHQRQVLTMMASLSPAASAWPRMISDS